MPGSSHAVISGIARTSNIVQSPNTSIGINIKFIDIQMVTITSLKFRIY